MRHHRRPGAENDLSGCFSVAVLIKRFSVKIMAEIGVCEGRTATEVLFQNELDKYYFIDPWINFEKIYRNIVDNFKEPCIEIIRKKSMDALSIIGNESLDLVYIDARHEYESFRNDLSGWSKKVKKGGIIAGHDYDHPRHPNFGVKRAVDETFWREEINLEKGTVFWVIKR